MFSSGFSLEEANVLSYFQLHGSSSSRYAHRGQTISRKYYMERAYREHLCIKTHGCNLKNVHFSLQLVWQLNFKRGNMKDVNRSLYFSDLAICEIWLFPKVKTSIAGNPFHRIQNLSKSINSELYSLSASEYRGYLTYD